MTESGWPRHTFSIGVFEFRRSVRALWQDKARFGMIAFGVLLFAVLATGIVYLFADELRGIGPLSISATIRGTVALFWLFMVFMVGQRVVSARTHIEAEPLMLMSVSTGTVAGGLLVAETLRVLAYAGLYAVIGTAVAVVLLESLPSLVMVPLAAVLFVATAVVTGSVCGYAIAWLVASSRFIARHKTMIGTVAGLVLMGAYFLFLSPQIGGVDQAALAWLPMAWFADLAAVGPAFVGSSLRAGGALVGSALVVVIGEAIITRETGALWFIDPVSPEIKTGSERITPTDETGAPTETPSRQGALATAIRPLTIPQMVSIPTRRVAEWTLLRARREPNRLTFVLIPVFAIGSSIISTSLQSGSIRAIAAPAAAIVIAWLAGALFALNPLGDEGTVLPVTLTAVSGNHYVRGLMTPGLLLGLPVVVVVTAIADVFSPYTLGQQVGLVVLGGFLTCIAVGITPAIGMALPRFSAISIGRSDDVLPPRITATVVHLLLVVVPGVALALVILTPKIARGALAVLVGTLPAFILNFLNGSGGPLSAAANVFEGIGVAVRTLGLVQFRVGSGVVLVLGGLLVACLLYRHAIRRFDRFSPV